MNDDKTGPLTPSPSPPPRGDLEPGGSAVPGATLPGDPATWSPQAMPPSRPNRTWVIVGGVIAIVVLAIILVSMLDGSSSAMPDEFSGAERVDSGPMAEFFDAFSEPFDELGMDVEFALYGGSLTPRYMILAMEGPGVAGGGDLSSGSGTGFAGGMGAQVDMTEAIEETDGTTDYLCVPATGSQFSALGGTIAMCMYQDGDQAAIVMAFDNEDLNVLMDKTKELHDQLVN